MRFQTGRLRMYVALIALSCGVMGVRGAEAAPNEPSASPAHRLAGSWIVTYDVPAFGAPFDLLLSMGNEGVVIETDAPGAFPLGPISVVLSNGHGAWETGRRPGTFTYLYRKLVFQQDGLTPFGTTRTVARGTVGPSGERFDVTLVIQILDGAGEVLFEASGTAIGRRITVQEP